MCMQRACSVCECDDNEVPAPWLAAEKESVAECKAVKSPDCSTEDCKWRFLGLACPVKPTVIQYCINAVCKDSTIYWTCTVHYAVGIKLCSILSEESEVSPAGSILLGLGNSGCSFQPQAASQLTPMVHALVIPVWLYCVHS